MKFYEVIHEVFNIICVLHITIRNCNHENVFKYKKVCNLYFIKKNLKLFISDTSKTLKTKKKCKCESEQCVNYITLKLNLRHYFS